MGILKGVGYQLFIIDDDDSIQRLSMARLDRLLQFDERETLPRYVGKRIRCALAVLDVAGRQVLTVRHIDYFFLPLDVEGRIDQGEWTQGVRLALEVMSTVLRETQSKQIIDARDRFMKRRYDHEFKWKPSRKVEEGIVAAILRQEKHNKNVILKSKTCTLSLLNLNGVLTKTSLFWSVVSMRENNHMLVYLLRPPSWIIPLRPFRYCA